jgi:hypothetical protein
MKKHDLAFKETQFFEWDSEPKAERPSEFHTTGFSTASGYYHSLGEPGRTAPARRSHRSGSAMLILGLMAAIGLGTLGVLWLAQVLRG